MLRLCLDLCDWGIDKREPESPLDVQLVPVTNQPIRNRALWMSGIVQSGWRLNPAILEVEESAPGLGKKEHRVEVTAFKPLKSLSVECPESFGHAVTRRLDGEHFAVTCSEGQMHHWRF